MARRFLSLMMAAALVAAAPAQAQRASLADRVAAVEQQVFNTSANQDLLNQLQQLRVQLQEMQSTIEQLQNENEQLKQRSRDQYLDLDGRLERLEGGASPAMSNDATPAAAQAPAAKKPEAADKPVAAARAAAPSGEERVSYNVAFDALKAGRFTDAAELFLSFLELYPAGVYTPNAIYWLGESYYAAGKYGQAQQQFRQLLDQFPTHDKAAGGLLKLGLSQYNAGDPAAAEASLLQVAQRYPGSDAARTAAERLRSLRLGQHALR